MEDHARQLGRAAGAERVAKRAVRDEQRSVRAHGEAERPLQRAGDDRADHAVAEQFGDLAGDAGYEDAVADEADIVEAGTKIGKDFAGAADRVDAQHLAAGDLGGDDAPLAVELDRVRHAQIATTSCAPVSKSTRQISLAPMTGT